MVPGGSWMESAFRLRPFRPGDLEEVMSINERCLPENYTHFFFMDLHQQFPETFLVAEEDGRVVGYIMCRVETGMSDLRLIGIGKKGHIISIAVLPEHRRRGVAQALVGEAMKAMQQRYKAKECYLEVRVGNTPAVSLYKKMGFQVTQTLRGYYSDGEAAHKMARKLPPEDQTTDTD